MAAAIKALTTRYDGITFRSRLEARWAVFFKHLGVPYEYEPEGFDLGDAGYYLPDFWLPKQTCWVEIKPQSSRISGPVRTQTFAKLEHLIVGTGHPAFLCWGHPEARGWNPVTEEITGTVISYWDNNGTGLPFWDADAEWAKCARCGIAGIYPCWGYTPCQHGGSPHPDLARAYAAAKAARFDHTTRAFR